MRRVFPLAQDRGNTPPIYMVYHFQVHLIWFEINHIDRKGIPPGPGQGEYPSFLYGLSFSVTFYLVRNLLETVLAAQGPIFSVIELSEFLYWGIVNLAACCPYLATLLIISVIVLRARWISQRVWIWNTAIIQRHLIFSVIDWTEGNSCCLVKVWNVAEGKKSTVYAQQWKRYS